MPVAPSQYDSEAQFGTSTLEGSSPVPYNPTDASAYAAYVKGEIDPIIKKYGASNVFDAQLDLNDIQDPQARSDFERARKLDQSLKGSGSIPAAEWYDNTFNKTFDPKGYAQQHQLADVERGMYSTGLPYDYAEGQKRKAMQAGQRSAPELDLADYNRVRQMQSNYLYDQNARQGDFISAGYEGQKALGQSAEQASQVAARGGRAGQVAQQHDIYSQVGQRVLAEDMATRNRLALAGTQARAQDIQVEGIKMQAQVAQMQSNQAMVQFYLLQGMDYNQAQRQVQLEAAKLFAIRQGMGEKSGANTLGTAAQVVGTVAAFL